MGATLLIVFALMLAGVLPTWSHSARWGYFPPGGLGLAVTVVIVPMLPGRI